GRPLPDVRPDEIEIVENGKPLPIVLFQRVQEPSGFYADAAMRAVSAEVTSNDATPRGHLYIFVFDQQHITSGNEQKAREAAATFIRTRVRASDRVAMFGVPGPGPDLPFTSDAHRALTELGKVHGSLERTVMSGLGRIGIQEAYDIAGGDQAMADKVMQRLESDLSADVGGTSAANTGGGKAENSFFNEEHSTKLKIMQENTRAIVQRDEATTRDLLARLSELMIRFKSVEGRKTLVLFSEGFHGQNVSRDLQDVAAAAAESYCVFYAMDLNRRLADLQNANGSSPPVAIEIQSRTAALAGLALETDGVFVNDATTHLDEALKQIADQSQDYYLAGFLPSEEALAQRGSYRRVTVRVKRPGARVSARTGYAVPSNAAAPDRRNAIDAALAAPFSQQALKVAYTTYVLRAETTGRPRVALSLTADLPLKDDRHDRADVVFVVRDVRDGRVVASGSDTMPLPDQAVPGEYLGRGTYRVQFDVPPGAYMMRAVVREPGGLLGSADRRVDVRDVAGPSIAASDLVLGSATRALPVRAQVYSEDGLSGMLEIYGRSPEQLAHVQVGLSLALESGGEARTFEASLEEAQTVPGGALRRARFSMPLAGLAPGAYVVRAHVQDGREEISTLSRQLDIVSGTAPAAPQPPPPDPRSVAQGATFKQAQGEWVTAAPALASHATKGFDLFTRGDFSGAAAELEQAFDGSQKSAATAFVLGWAWEGAGDMRKAIGAWRAAASADPSLVPAHLAIADAYLQLSHPELATQALRAGLAARPDSVELQTKLDLIERRRQSEPREPRW
ncbi:MAG TPA: VWA domain-containing protein, partial [Vicinamibacterales bacterium]|nr:VWA domain-containing protein [Vicinamibacterales bacterium]